MHISNSNLIISTHNNLNTSEVKRIYFYLMSSNCFIIVIKNTYLSTLFSLYSFNKISLNAKIQL